MSGSSLVIAFVLILVISAVFSLFGKGGGSLYTPVLLLLGVALQLAIPTALFLSLVTAVTATIVFHRASLIDYQLAFAFLPGTVTGSLMGSALSTLTPRSFLLVLFSAFLYTAGLLLFLSGKQKALHPAKREPRGRTLAWITLFSSAVGLLSSLLGVGGGLLIFPFLVIYMRHEPQIAAGTNALIVTVSSLAGFLGHLTFRQLDIRLLAVTSIACMLGSMVGSHVTVKASGGFLKVAFAILMWLFATHMAFDLWKAHRHFHASLSYRRPVLVTLQTSDTWASERRFPESAENLPSKGIHRSGT